MKLAQRPGLRRSQFLGLGILACIGASYVHPGWLRVAVAVIGIAFVVLGFSGIVAPGLSRRASTLDDPADRS